MVINSEEIEKIKQGQLLGGGKIGEVFKLNENAYKIFKSNELQVSQKSLEALVKIKNNSFVFPKEMIYDKEEKLIGYEMNFINGEKLTEVISGIEIEKLLAKLEELEIDTRELSKEGVVLTDAHQDNYFWNNKEEKIQVIDTDYFTVVEQNTQNSNMSKMSGELDKIIGMKSLPLNSYIKNNKGLFEQIKNITKESDEQGILRIGQIIKSIKEEAEKEFGKEFITLGEIKEQLVE